MALEELKRLLFGETYHIERYSQFTPVETLISGENISKEDFDNIIALVKQAYQVKIPNSANQAFLNTYQQIEWKNQRNVYLVVEKDIVPSKKQIVAMAVVVVIGIATAIIATNPKLAEMMDFKRL